MAYCGIENKTDCTAELALLADEQGRDVLLVLAKASYQITDDGTLRPADEPQPICFEGQYFGEPGKSSLKIAPEANFAKLATDVVLIAHAYAPDGKAALQFDVGIQVGHLRQRIRVFGDRVWQKRAAPDGQGHWQMTEAKPLLNIPLIYEKAYGGQDLTPDDSSDHAVEPRNLLGTGVIAKHSKREEVALPNLEDPHQLIQRLDDRPTPMGMGFISPDWQPRLGLSGTYDDAWEQTRMPMLPADFKREFFNAAHPGLIADGFLSGSEPVRIINASPQGELGFTLPGNPPQISIKYQYDDPKPLSVTLDTVVVNTDEMTLSLLWRATDDVFNKIYQLEKVQVEYQQRSQQRHQAHSNPQEYDLAVLAN